jgi:hypothetical protein
MHYTFSVLFRLGDKWSHKITITSCNDGKHMATSYHYRNHALDIRTNDLPPKRVDEFYLDLKETFGTNYDIVKEKDHIHLEPSPRSQYA